MFFTQVMWALSLHNVHHYY